MGIVKTFSLLCLLLMTVSTEAQTSRQARSTQSTQSALEKTLERELKLSEAQKKKWAEINGRYRPKIKGARDKYSPQLAKLQLQIRLLNGKLTGELKPTLDARRKELDRVLTPEQRKKKDALNAALRAAIQRRLSGGNLKP